MAEGQRCRDNGARPSRKLKMKENKKNLFIIFFLLIWIAAFCANLGNNVLNSSVTLYCDSLNYSETVTGIISIGYCIMALVGRFVAKRMAEVWKQRHVIAAGCLVFALSTLTFGWTKIPVLLIILRSFQGLGFSVVQTAAATANLEVTPPEKVKMAVGAYWLSNSLSIGLNGILIETVFHSQAVPVFYCVSVFMAIGIVCALLCTYEKGRKAAPVEEKKPEPKYRGVSRYIEKSALPVGFCAFLLCLVIMLTNIFALYSGKERGFDNPELYFVFGAAFMLAANLIFSIFGKRLGNRLFVTIGLTAHILTLLLLAFVPCSLSYYACGIGYGIMLGLCMPAYNAQAVVGVDEDRKGAANVVIFAAADIGSAVGSFFWGWIVDEFYFSTAYIVAAVILVITMVLSFLFIPRMKKGE